MKFCCENVILSGAVAAAARAVPAKTTIEALKSLRMQVEGGILTVTGYDLTIGIQSSVEVDGSEDGVCLVDAKLFQSITARMPDDVVIFEATSSQMTITSGPTAFTLAAFSAEEYPELPSVEPEHSAEMTQADLRSMIQATFFAVSQDLTKITSCGSDFEIAGGELTVVACDGFRLAVRSGKVSCAEDDFSCIVPRSTLKILSTTCADTGDPARIEVSQKHIAFLLGDLRIISRRIEGMYFDWKKTIPLVDGARIAVETPMLAEAVERVSAVVSDKVKVPLRLNFMERALHISASSSIGSASDSCSIPGCKTELEIGFNGRYLLDALRAVDGPSELQVIAPGSPVILRPASAQQPSFLYMILPVRLRAQL